MRRWLKRLLLAAIILALLFVFVVFPVAASFLITSARIRFPESGPTDPKALGLAVSNVEFRSDDGILLKGWWLPGKPDMPAIIFVHGLNRSRLEMLERAAAASERGYSILLFDLRGHGESGSARRTLGISESRDVCAARDFVRRQSPRPYALWGVSLGASTALLSERRCAGATAIVSDSSFLSFSETIEHHVRLLHIPAFPIANTIIGLTAWRTGVKPADGNVEAAVAAMGDVPILFIAGGADVRMPPELAQRLAGKATSPLKELMVVPKASHGHAFQLDREGYLHAAFSFIDRAAARSR